MSKLTRRNFLVSATSVPFVLWLHGCKGCGPSDGDGPGDGGNGGNGDTGGTGNGALVRYDARSPQGQAMLQTYADAVNKMQTTIAEGDPTSWLFQWYTHGVKSTTTKAAEIARIYPSPSPHRDLADEMWNTCQAHYPGDDENFFLPWHRMYVYYFEQIIRQVSGEASFTLPYWNYSIADPAIHGVIPEQFRLQGDPVFGPLFVAKRNPGVNAGQSIAQGQPGDPLSTVALSECAYEPAGAVQGFNMRLDFGLHGNIHVLTGNGQNMGAVPWAAGDPIFWMHHCNIDRLWASWNAAGRSNPSSSQWLDQTFVFANANGQRVEREVGDFTDIAPLGYSYDHLEPAPSCPEAMAAVAAAADEMQPRMAAAAPVALAADPVRVRLQAMPGAERFSLPEALGSMEERRLFLVVKGHQTEVQPEVLYHVYLELPAGAEAAGESPHYVGSVNFFGTGAHGDHGDRQPISGSPGMPEKFLSFDVTDVARRLGSEGALSARPTLTIAPAGEPAAEARPVLGEVMLVEQ